MQGPYVLIATMDVDAGKEDLFNRVYDEEHIPSLSQVPGVLSIVRFEKQDLTMIIGGEMRHLESPHAKYHALYELDSPDVLVSAAWAKAVDYGRWSREVRPFTRDRRYLLAKKSWPLMSMAD